MQLLRTASLLIGSTGSNWAGQTPPHRDGKVVEVGQHRGGQRIDPCLNHLTKIDIFDNNPIKLRHTTMIRKQRN